MKVLITGASGFIGSVIYNVFCRLEALEVVGCSRKGGYPLVNSPSLNALSDWTTVVEGVDVVIHTAARAHVLDESSSEPLTDFRRANVDGTIALAKQAAESGVRRFVFISSIGVNGSSNVEPFSECHAPNPESDYAQSKFEAEVGLQELAKETGLEVVIIRPPLVYGPNAPGNFGLLAKVVAKGVPLPLAKIRNRRSFVSIWNLVDLITVCLDHPKAAGEVFVVSDGDDVSTSDLLQKIGTASGHPAKLFWVPRSILKVAVTLIGKRDVYDRLFSSLQVDAGHVRKTLEWSPPLSLDEGLRRCFY
ncbi:MULTISPECIES: NAD-dependent epimerase/dehydratase family protein [Halomonas]|uniref:UDP-glucose 4-epimerase n=1 Tax=Halomonas halophila TaxID=29573 RepID=A0ABQ0U5H9_9GAMM|nr:MULTISPECIES: NAD-dependent epimerase/dehydratase family protein [Halomonas]MDR5890202.1 NAD-dependent epimerase/dehydratase family protein [Halomonas salina]WJY05879.1 NAD-dependent epimerase/dehydratase family protein [Halomonas halophila]GEK73665.1 UDP-glucose 4-epimerase [Halomonas halophila]